jgi:hypothetical protein
MAPPSCALTWLSCECPVFPDAKRENRHRTCRFSPTERNHAGANRTTNRAERVHCGAIGSIDRGQRSDRRRRSSPRPIERSNARCAPLIGRAMGSIPRVERSNRRITWMPRRAKRSNGRIERSHRRVKRMIAAIERSPRRLKRLAFVTQRSSPKGMCLDGRDECSHRWVKSFAAATERSPRLSKRLSRAIEPSHRRAERLSGAIERQHPRVEGSSARNSSRWRPRSSRRLRVVHWSSRGRPVMARRQSEQSRGARRGGRRLLAPRGPGGAPAGLDRARIPVVGPRSSR